MKLTELFYFNLRKIFGDTSPKKLAVAVSGGVDSMCLTYLLKTWCAENNCELFALTVDHHLRTNSTDEALQVQTWMHQSNIGHSILNWRPKTEIASIQNSAREARYRLLTDWCLANDIPILALAHTSDDQYETLIQRLAHHSGPLGLAGIPIMRETAGVKLVRPLLSAPKSDIKRYMNEEKHGWIEDPSNTKLKFSRVKIRLNRPLYESKGLTYSRIELLQKQMAVDREQIEKLTLDKIRTDVRFLTEGFVIFNLQKAMAYPDRVFELFLISLLKFISGKTYAPPTDVLLNLIHDIKDPNFKGHACHGCYIYRSGLNITISREEAAIKLNQPFINHMTTWDNRFLIELETRIQLNDIIIRPLSDWWIELKKNKKLIDLPLAVRRTIPSIWEKEQLILVPHVDYDVSSDKKLKCKLTYLPILDLCRSRFIID